MNFINDKSVGLKSIAVWLPTVLTILVVILDTFVQSQIVPTTWIPLVVFVSGFLGRIIKQPNLNE